MCKAYFLLSGQKLKHIPWDRAVTACSVGKPFFLRAVVNGWTYRVKLTKYFKKHIKPKMKIQSLVSLSVLQYLGNNCYSFTALSNWQSRNDSVFVVKASHANKRNEWKTQMVCLILQEPQLKLNCESGLTLYPRRSFFFFPPPVYFLFVLFIVWFKTIRFELVNFSYVTTWHDGGGQPLKGLCLWFDSLRNFIFL